MLEVLPGMSMAIEPIPMPATNYSVVVQNLSEKAPAQFYHTDKREEAAWIYESYKTSELEYGGHGEFTITFYEHSDESTIECTLAEVHNGEFLHLIAFPGSRIIKQLNHRNFTDALEAAMKQSHQQSSEAA